MFEEINLRKVGELKGKCPICGRESFIITYNIYSVPNFGDVLIESGKCLSCGFKWTDVGTLEFTQPKKLVLRVKKASDLNALVIKSARAVVKIPELGIEITPGPAAEGYITTVEGVLLRVLDHVPSECLKKGSKCHGKIQLIQEAMSGEVPFTLIIEDPTGKSSIAGEGAEIEIHELTN